VKQRSVAVQACHCLQSLIAALQHCILETPHVSHHRSNSEHNSLLPTVDAGLLQLEHLLPVSQWELLFSSTSTSCSRRHRQDLPKTHGCSQNLRAQSRYCSHSLKKCCLIQPRRLQRSASSVKVAWYCVATAVGLERNCWANWCSLNVTTTCEDVTGQSNYSCSVVGVSFRAVSHWRELFVRTVCANNSCEQFARSVFTLTRVIR